mmetsp:Transcript_71142/g.230247  ORF Transcript_71142/g.230247 Transcript_71142/m.230247 type:complete len:291 (+) Transcript_71142:139-1011(+)
MVAAGGAAPACRRSRPGSPAAPGAQPTTPSLRSLAMSSGARPSSCSTASVCSPKPGAPDLGSAFCALSSTGLPMSRWRTPGACTKIPDCEACSSSNISSKRWIRWCQTSCASKIRLHSAYVLVAITASTTRVAWAHGTVSTRSAPKTSFTVKPNAPRVFLKCFLKSSPTKCTQTPSLHLNGDWVMRVFRSPIFVVPRMPRGPRLRPQSLPAANCAKGWAMAAIPERMRAASTSWPCPVRSRWKSAKPMYPASCTAVELSPMAPGKRGMSASSLLRTMSMMPVWAHHAAKS